MVANFVALGENRLVTGNDTGWSLWLTDLTYPFSLR